MGTVRTWLVAVVVVAAVSSLQADNWPHWRGPQHNGVSTEARLPLRWSTTENVTWKLSLPSYSGSTPIIWGETIFLSVADAHESGDLYLWAVDRTAATVRWKRRLGSGNHREMKQNMSSPSPVTDGTRVFVMTGTGILKAFDFAGSEVWPRDIQRDHGRFGLNWGYASSLLLHGNALYVRVMYGMKTDEPSYVLKIDAGTGKTL